MRSILAQAHLFGVMCASLAAFQLLIMLVKVVRTARKHRQIEDINAEDGTQLKMLDTLSIGAIGHIIMSACPAV